MHSGAPVLAAFETTPAVTSAEERRPDGTLKSRPARSSYLSSYAHAHEPGACHARRMKARKFDAQAFLASSGIEKTIVEFERGATIFTQGDACEDVCYIQSGGVKLSVLSKGGREAVVAMLGPGDFFGEGCLASQPLRMSSATAITPSVILFVAKDKMVRLLHRQHGMSDRFIAHMLTRNTRIEEDLVDQLFNSNEKRLARTLLLLARYGNPDKPVRMVPNVSEEALAEMIGTTPSRVSFFLNKFKKLGFIEYNGQIRSRSTARC